MYAGGRAGSGTFVAACTPNKEKENAGSNLCETSFKNHSFQVTVLASRVQTGQGFSVHAIKGTKLIFPRGNGEIKVPAIS